MVRAHRISEDSAFLGQSCALCKQSFEAGDLIVICPEDGSRHHDHCWRANGNHCTAYGCNGQGEIGVGIGSSRRRPQAEPSRPVVITSPTTESSAPNSPPGSKVRVFPARNFGCARSCLFLFVILTLVLLGAACFGVYSLAEEIFRDFGGPQPTPLPTMQVTLSSLRDLVAFIHL